jgi:uncharacterized protein YggT (Ycf19 family)
VAAVLGTVVATAGLAAAVTIAGPAVRHWIGSPVDFDQDYSAASAVKQALLAQGASLFILFSLLGLVAKWCRISVVNVSLWAANPLTIGVGYGLYRLVEPTLRPWEYFSYADWIILTLLSPLVLIPAVIAGGRIGLYLYKGPTADQDQEDQETKRTA